MKLLRVLLLVVAMVALLAVSTDALSVQRRSGKKVSENDVDQLISNVLSDVRNGRTVMAGAAKAGEKRNTVIMANHNSLHKLHTTAAHDGKK